MPLAVASRSRRLVGAVLGTEALDRGPGFHQRAIDREVLVRQKASDLGVAQHCCEKLASDIGVEQPVAVLRERGVVPNRIVNAEPDEPAKQKIVVDLLHQLALGADRVERLQQRSPQQPFRRDRLPPGIFVKCLELPIERGQHLVHDRPDRAQRMRRRYPLLHIHIREQGTRSRI